MVFPSHIYPAVSHHHGDAAQNISTAENQLVMYSAYFVPQCPTAQYRACLA